MAMSSAMGLGLLEGFVYLGFGALGTYGFRC